MKPIIASVIVATFLVGCGAGTPDTSVTVNNNNSQNQTNDQNQVQNESELDCNTTCSVIPGTSGQIANAEESCEGGAVGVVAVQSLDECDSIIELVQVQATPTPEAE